LRERGHDVVELANWLLRRISHKLSKPEMSLSESALVAIGRYDWPGNVRELENALERAVILCDGTVIEADLLAIDTVKAPRRSSQSFTEETEGETSLEGYFVKFVLEHQDALTENRTRKQTRHQPEESLGTTSTAEHSAKTHRHPSTATRQRTVVRRRLISLFDSTI
jgi:DNA-binding NtrC family response regulator